MTNTNSASLLTSSWTTNSAFMNATSTVISSHIRLASLVQLCGESIARPTPVFPPHETLLLPPHGAGAEVAAVQAPNVELWINPTASRPRKGLRATQMTLKCFPLPPLHLLP